LLEADVGNPDMPNLALLLEVNKGPKGIFQRNLGIDAMKLEKICSVSPEAR